VGVASRKKRQGERNHSRGKRNAETIRLIRMKPNLLPEGKKKKKNWDRESGRTGGGKGGGSLRGVSKKKKKKKFLKKGRFLKRGG